MFTDYGESWDTFYKKTSASCTSHLTAKYTNWMISVGMESCRFINVSHLSFNNICHLNAAFHRLTLTGRSLQRIDSDFPKIIYHFILQISRAIYQDICSCSCETHFINIAIPDRGAGNNLEALQLAFQHQGPIYSLMHTVKLLYTWLIKT